MSTVVARRTVVGKPLPPRSNAVAIIGARAATPYGTHVAGELAYQLAEAGVAVVSGGAFGIDSAAHRGALAANGHTVAVLPCGVNVCYPRANDRLFSMIRETGSLVSEYEDGDAPTRQRFLERNGVIVALVSAVIVVEASAHSGSLHTATIAYDESVPVFAVPGPLTSATSAGCHRLIADGHARILTDTTNVAALVGVR